MYELTALCSRNRDCMLPSVTEDSICYIIYASEKYQKGMKTVNVLKPKTYIMYQQL